MKQNCKKRLARFLRDLGAEHDTFDITCLTLTALKNALTGLDSSPKAFKTVCRELIHMIRQSRPEAVPLNHLLDYLELDLSGILTPGIETSALNQRILDLLNQRICQVERHRDALTERGASYLAQGDCILVHGADQSLISALVRARTRRQLDFRVMFQDLYPEKTSRMVEAFRKGGVAYDLVGKEEIPGGLGHVSKLFLGAMSVTRDKKILAPSGTAEIVRHCRQAGIPTHFFADTLHYAFGCAGTQPIFSGGACRGDGEMGATTRDLVSLDLVDHVVTEIGEVTKSGLLMSGPENVSAIKEDSGLEPGSPILDEAVRCPETISA